MQASNLIFIAAFLFAAVSTAASIETLQVLQERKIESLGSLDTKISERSPDEKRGSIAIEDCLKGIPDRFALVMITAARARKLLASTTEQKKLEKEKHIQITQQDLQELQAELQKCWA